MSLMTAIEVGASGLAAQRKRIEVHISNLVNANTTKPAGTAPFQRKEVIFTASQPETSFGDAFSEASQGVEISGVVTDKKDPISRYEPGHIHADKNGYVLYPDIDVMKEMTDIMSATRSYEANLQAVSVVKDMQQKTLQLLS